MCTSRKNTHKYYLITKPSSFCVHVKESEREREMLSKHTITSPFHIPHLFKLNCHSVVFAARETDVEPRLHQITW